ncbi:Formate/nitrite transporter [Tribonema minus]|uniref:Formate/nitrite transporter n=1 Tax=Tribonema minus TaxID=303371 RepID=A0A835Z6S8_9STRA|nr:Formate/nitrite transporter [Tribonema minus]
MGQRKAKLVTNEPKKTLILGVLAGAYISVGALLALTIGANCPGLVGSNQGLQRLIYGAIGLPFGLFFTLVCGGELFTGNTAAMMAAVLEKRATVKQLAKNWVVSFSANLVASLAMAWLVFHSGVVFNPAAAVGMAVYKTKLSFGAAFIRGMLCNWLVCMAVWMASGCTSATDKFVSIWLPITAFTAIGFEHSVANMFLIPLGIMHGAPVSMATFFIKNLLPVTLGNILGGALGISGAYSMVYGDLDKEAESRYI